LLPRRPGGPTLLVSVFLDAAHVTGDQAHPDDRVRAGYLPVMLRPCGMDLVGELLSFRGDLVVEVMQTTLRLRLDFLLRREQPAVLREPFSHRAIRDVSFATVLFR
jgi:hypothetical protein